MLELHYCMTFVDERITDIIKDNISTIPLPSRPRVGSTTFVKPLVKNIDMSPLFQVLSEEQGNGKVLCLPTADFHVLSLLSGEDVLVMLRLPTTLSRTSLGVVCSIIFFLQFSKKLAD